MRTSLDSYMKQKGIGDAELAAAINRDRSMANKLRNGNAQPTLEVAAAIEKFTDGAVPMQAWTPAPPAVSKQAVA